MANTIEGAGRIAGSWIAKRATNSQTITSATIDTKPITIRWRRAQADSLSITPAASKATPLPTERVAEEDAAWRCRAMDGASDMRIHPVEMTADNAADRDLLRCIDCHS